MKSGGKNVRSTDKRKIEELIILNKMKFIPEEIKKGKCNSIVDYLWWGQK
jgi:hypothetical protein